MSEEHPPTSDASPKQKPFFDQQQLPRGSVSRFLSGFLGGVGVSAIIWTLGGRYMISESEDFVLPLLAVGGFKLVTSIILILQSRRFRPLGIGLLGSAPIGVDRVRGLRQ